MHEHTFVGRIERVDNKITVRQITTKGDFYLEVDMEAVLNGFMGKTVKITVEEL